jgi:hypothetical protein
LRIQLLMQIMIPGSVGYGVKPLKQLGRVFEVNISIIGNL